MSDTKGSGSTTYLASSYSVSGSHESGTNISKLAATYDTSSSILKSSKYNLRDGDLALVGDNSSRLLPEPTVSRLPVAGTTSTMLSFFGLVTSDDAQFVLPANNLVTRLLNMSQGLFVNALRKCREVLDSVDIADEDSKQVARQRIRDLFEVFSELSVELVKELTTAYRDRPDVVGFVLSEVFVEVDA